MDPPTQPPTAATRPAIAGSPTTGGIPALFARAIGRPHALRRCIVLLTGLGAAYALSIELLALGGGTPGTAPWLAIPMESYFFVEPAFTAPVIVLGAILASAVAYLLATAFGSRGTFDDTLVAVGLATCIATLFSLVPDFVMGLITAAGLADGASWAEDLLRPSPARTFLWTYLTLYTLAFLVLYPLAVRSAHHQLRSGNALAVGWAAFLVYQGFLLVFIR